MRKNLQDARKKKGFTQTQVAETLGIPLDIYRAYEYEYVDGRVKIWDKLEDLLGINQRKLREYDEPPRCPTCGQTIKKKDGIDKVSQAGSIPSER